MAARVAINGLGRIGRATLKSVLAEQGLDVVAVNDIAPADNLAYLLRHDTVHRRFDGDVTATDSALSQEAASDRYRGVLGVVDEPLVSSDIVADPRASVVDLTLTTVTDGDLLKVMAWYDNEWGYAQQMVRRARAMVGVPAASPR